MNRAGRTGGTFLHTSRTNPCKVKKSSLPDHLKDAYTEERNDLTPEVLKTLTGSASTTLFPSAATVTLAKWAKAAAEK